MCVNVILRVSILTQTNLHEDSETHEQQKVVGTRGVGSEVYDGSSIIKSFDKKSILTLRVGESRPKAMS